LIPNAHLQVKSNVAAQNTILTSKWMRSSWIE
jgi:hypothetical protein